MLIGTMILLVLVFGFVMDISGITAVLLVMERTQSMVMEDGLII